jgi:hypothetical protein
MYKALHTDGISPPYILIYAYRSIGRWINIETPEHTQRSIANNSKPSMVYLINNLY